MKWQEPPASIRGAHSSKWDQVGAKLRDRPRIWALVATLGSASAGTYAKKVLGPDFEVTTRRTADGKVDVYARYVGGETA